MKKLFMKLIILSLGVFLLILIGCRGDDMTIDGKAYEWVDAPPGSSSMVFILEHGLTPDANPGLSYEQTIKQAIQKLDVSIPTHITRIPLANVKIAIGHSGITENEVTSNMTGEFRSYVVTSAGRYPVTITASKDGYISARGKIVNKLPFANVIIAVLVKNENDI